MTKLIGAGLLSVIFLTAPLSAQGCGDCNQDGVLSILDALRAALHAVLLAPVAGQQFLDCDVDSSSAVDVIDALILAQLAAGLPVLPSCLVPQAEVLEVSTVPATVDRGQMGIALSVTVQNDCSATLAVTAVSLSFMGTVDRAADYAVAPSPGNPTQIAPLATAQFDFLIDVSLTAAIEAITLDASFDGAHPPTGVPVQDAGATIPDAWQVRGSMAPTTWVLQSPIGVTPPARGWHCMVQDTTRDVAVMYGGSDNVTWFDDTWEWNGATSTWTESPGAGPPGRQWHQMAFDSTRGYTVLFGGWEQMAGGSNATWEYDGTWVQRFPAVLPPARRNSAMAHDSARGVTVLFGGLAPGLASDIWEWDGNNWVQRFPAPGPIPRWFHSMAFDSSRGVTVLFGGLDNSIPLDDTWDWNGTSWSLSTTPIAPAPRYGHGLSFDSARGVMVCFGGSDNGAVWFGDTWEYDGSVWSQVFPTSSPSLRFYVATCYDSARFVTTLFGGLTPPPAFTFLQDTWEY